MRLSLSLKFCLPLIAGAFGFTLVAFLDFVPSIRRGFEDQEARFTQTLPSLWAHMFRHDLPGNAVLEERLSEVPQLTRPGYAVILGDKDQVRAIAGEWAEKVLAQPGLLKKNGQSTFHLDNLEVLQVRVPIPGQSGAVAVGFNRALTLEHFQSLRMRLAIIIAVALTLAVSLGIYYGRKVIEPLSDLTFAANRIADTGDLTHGLQEHGEDEIGRLARAFMKMVNRQKEIVLNLQESIALMAVSVENMSSAADEQNQTVARQAAALQETQVTAQEIKQTSLLASQKADAVIRVAERADELGRAGEAALTESLGGFAELKASVQEIAVRISELGARAAQIGGITQTVKDLADQSNMLALNAAIEAVRSGEHGKGFAVVAKEIRLLADQSIQATERVREILEDIGGAISSAVAISEKGTAKVESNLIQVRASGESLKELSNIVRDNSSAVRQIAGAVSQQNAGISQIFTAVTDLTRMMDDTVKRIESTHGSAAALQELSTRVAGFVKSYRV